MALPWILADAAANSTCNSPITAGAATVVLQSTAAFPSSGFGQMPVTILDSGNPAWNPLFPLATPYEYAYVTANNTGTNTLTWTRGQAGTTGHAFLTGATVAATTLAEILAANSGAFARIDKVAGALQLGGLAGSAGAPASGTYAAGDEYEDSGGSKWVCITGGAPGTWRRVDGWFGLGAPLAGSGGTLNSKLKMQASTSVTTTNGAGGFGINYPVAFPNGVFSVVACPGDNAGGNQLNITLISANCTASALNGVISQGTSAIVSSAVRINWMAVGW